MTRRMLVVLLSLAFVIGTGQLVSLVAGSEPPESPAAETPTPVEPAAASSAASPPVPVSSVAPAPSASLPADPSPPASPSPVPPAAEPPSEAPAAAPSGLSPEAVAAIAALATGDTFARDHHEQEVMTSRFCASCHPAIYAEHEQSTHGRAFTDAEVRLATGRFDHGDCIVCHTPRPIFETGIGMNPMRRYYGLDEGNTCMTCHWKEGVDYGAFRGGAECTTAFDPRVGDVEACASCHRNHGTPYQWALSPLGKGRDRTCIDCHMDEVTRPVAVGEDPRRVRSHIFPGCRSESQLNKAYRYEASIEDNEVVVRIENRGAGHNFPTELKQRSVESLVIVKDIEGNEVSQSRMVFRDPYKRPYGLHLPVNTQIPSGQTAEHRVPLKVEAGTVVTELHFKLYYPIEDYHPDLSRRLELRNLVFDGISPSDRPVETAPAVSVVTPEAIAPDLASPANLVDYARPPIGTVEMTFPEGDSPETIDELISFFMFPVPAGNAEAQRRLVEIGEPAIPALIEAAGSWDNKTWKQAMSVLRRIGEPAVPAIIDGVTSDQLYVRLHCRELLIQMQRQDDEGLEAALITGLVAANALDRASSAEALGQLGFASAAADVRALLADRDPDVVRAAALALSRLQDDESLPLIQGATGRFLFTETRRDLAMARARLGDASAVDLLLDGLDERDDLIRESYFEAAFGVTGLHFGYDPFGPRPERLESIAAIRSSWSMDPSPGRLRPWPEVDQALQAEAWTLVDKLGNGEDDQPMKERLYEMGDQAIPALVLGLKFPAGFATKRAAVCEVMGWIGSPDAVPALVSALRDPVIAVASWASWALGTIGDQDARPAVERFELRLHSLRAAGSIPESAGHPDQLLAMNSRTRLSLGDRSARRDLVNLLLSPDEGARQAAIDSLRDSLGYDLGFDPAGEEAERRAIVSQFMAEVQ